LRYLGTTENVMMKTFVCVGASLLAAVLIACGASSAHADILIGTAGSNDNAANVLSVITAYNTVNDPDLPTDFELFKKTDSDAAFVFNVANGITFWDAEVGGNQITTEGGLTSLNMAWFEYSGPESMLYNSINGGPKFSVCTSAAGRNKLEIDGSNADISHVSFWVPEPSRLGLAGLAGVAGLIVAGRARRCPPWKTVSLGPAG
jgi:hypothetical protein